MLKSISNDQYRLIGRCVYIDDMMNRFLEPPYRWTGALELREMRGFIVFGKLSVSSKRGVKGNSMRSQFIDGVLGP